MIIFTKTKPMNLNEGLEMGLINTNQQTGFIIRASLTRALYPGMHTSQVLMYYITAMLIHCKSIAEM